MEKRVEPDKPLGFNRDDGDSTRQKVPFVRRCSGLTLLQLTTEGMKGVAISSRGVTYGSLVARLAGH